MVAARPRLHRLHCRGVGVLKSPLCLPHCLQYEFSRKPNQNQHLFFVLNLARGGPQATGRTGTGEILAPSLARPAGEPKTSARGRQASQAPRGNPATFWCSQLVGL